MEELKRGMDDLKRAIKDAAADGDRSNINVAKRTNIVSATNVGGEGSTRAASSKQVSRIRQRDGETVEETFETRTEGS